MNNIFEFIRTQLQTRLDAYITAGTTFLRVVAVIDTNELERPREAYNDAQTLHVIYRELSSILPDMPVRDRTINGAFYVIALESEKVVVKTIIDDFIATYNATTQSDIIMRFTTLIPNGRPENIGAKIMQEWSFGFVGVVTDDLTTLWDKSITITSLNPLTKSWSASNETYWTAQPLTNRTTITNIEGLPDVDPELYAVGFALRVSDGVVVPTYTYFVITQTGTANIVYNVYNGLVTYTFNRTPIYAEYPTASGVLGKVYRYTKYSLQFVVIDNGDALLSDFVYASTLTREFTVTDTINTFTFDGFIVQATDSATGNGFSVKTIFVENG